MDLKESALSFMRNFDKNSAEAASYKQIKKALDDDGFKDIGELIDEYEQVKKQLAESQRRERAHEAAIKRHYDDMTSQCFICYSCVNHDARGHWNGKEPYACSGCGKSHPKWRFDEGRFAQEGTK